MRYLGDHGEGAAVDSPLLRVLRREPFAAMAEAPHDRVRFDVRLVVRPPENADAGPAAFGLDGDGDRRRRDVGHVPAGRRGERARVAARVDAPDPVVELLFAELRPYGGIGVDVLRYRARGLRYDRRIDLRRRHVGLALGAVDVVAPHAVELPAAVLILFDARPRDDERLPHRLDGEIGRQARRSLVDRHRRGGEGAAFARLIEAVNRGDLILVARAVRRPLDGRAVHLVRERHPRRVVEAAVIDEAEDGGDLVAVEVASQHRDDRRVVHLDGGASRNGPAVEVVAGRVLDGLPRDHDAAVARDGPNGRRRGKRRRAPRRHAKIGDERALASAAQGAELVPALGPRRGGAVDVSLSDDERDPVVTARVELNLLPRLGAARAGERGAGIDLPERKAPGAGGAAEALLFAREADRREGAQLLRAPAEDRRYRGAVGHHRDRDPVERGCGIRLEPARLPIYVVPFGLPVLAPRDEHARRASGGGRRRLNARRDLGRGCRGGRRRVHRRDGRHDRDPDAHGSCGHVESPPFGAHQYMSKPSPSSRTVTSTLAQMTQRTHPSSPADP